MTDAATTTFTMPAAPELFPRTQPNGHVHACHLFEGTTGDCLVQHWRLSHWNDCEEDTVNLRLHQPSPAGICILLQQWIDAHAHFEAPAPDGIEAARAFLPQTGGWGVLHVTLSRRPLTAEEWA